MNETIKNILFLQLILSINSLVNSQVPSPCPNILQYEPRSTELDRWYAIITLKSQEQLRGIWLRIILDRPAELLGNVFGDATTSDNREFLIRSQNYILESDKTTSVRFFVKYNAAAIIPSVVEVNLNGRTICKINANKSNSTKRNEVNQEVIRMTTVKNNNDNKNKNEYYNSHPPGGSSLNFEQQRPTGSGDGNSKFQLTETSGATMEEFEEFPTNNNNNFNSGSGLSAVNSEGSDEFFAGDFSTVVNRPPPISTPLKGSRNKNEQCGIVPSQPKPLISYGQNTLPGQWPWHAALYHSKGIQLMYTCGGTLISKRHVVTAAHCVTRPHTNRPINPQNILVYLGKYNLKKFGSEIQDKEVENIYIEPNYNYSVYFNDIAILRLAEPAEVTNFVRPVCLWSSNSDLNEIEGEQGTVVGWGFDQERQLSTNLMQAKMPIVSTVKCIYSNREFFSQFTSEKTFCAGFRNGTSVCNGDSGGGMVFPKKDHTGAVVWQIRGLVSVGVALQGQGVCDPSQYIVFTDVAKHSGWVQRILNEYS